MARRLTPLLCVLATACLPRVGDAVDGGHTALLADAGPDAGCASPTECASGVCASGRCLAALAPCPDLFFVRTGCGAGTDWLEVPPDAGPTTVRFPAGGETSYSPQCLRVHLGQRVAFQGPFGSHPLDQACGPQAGVVPRVGDGSSLVVTFGEALGTFGYYCENHGSPSGGGMAGAIQVVK